MLSLRQDVLCRSHRLTVLNRPMVLLSLMPIILCSLLFVILSYQPYRHFKVLLIYFLRYFFFQFFHHHLSPLSPLPPPPTALHPAAIYAVCSHPLKIHSDLPSNLFRNVSSFGDLFLSQGPPCDCSFPPHLEAVSVVTLHTFFRAPVSLSPVRTPCSSFALLFNRSLPFIIAVLC